jgi:hypothetical protein
VCFRLILGNRLARGRADHGESTTWSRTGSQRRLVGVHRVCVGLRGRGPADHFGSSDPEIFGDRIPGVAKLSDGRIAAAGATGDLLLLFGSDGEFLRTVGQPGPGPGEFSMILGLKNMPGDSLLVLQVGRASVVSESGEVVRSTTSSVSSQAALNVAPDGDVLYSGWISTPANAGKQFHVLDAHFDVIRSFCNVPAGEQANCGLCRYRPSAWSRKYPDHFWAVRPNRYEIELWHESGVLTRVLRIAESPWFEEWYSDRQAEIGASRSDEPQPYFYSIAEDDDGLLWLTAKVPTLDWKPLPGGLPTRLNSLNMPDELREYLDTQFDTVVEVLDPVAGEILASLRVEKDVLVPVDARTFRSKIQDPSGYLKVQLYAAALLVGG